MSPGSPADARGTEATVVIPGTSRLRHPPADIRLESTS